MIETFSLLPFLKSREINQFITFTKQDAIYIFLFVTTLEQSLFILESNFTLLCLLFILFVPCQFWFGSFGPGVLVLMEVVESEERHVREVTLNLRC